MPLIALPINDTDNTVTRFVADAVIRRLMDSTYMGNLSDIIYQPRGGQQVNRQSTKPAEPLKLDVDNYLLVEYKETPTEEAYDATKYMMEYPPIMSIPKLGIMAQPLRTRVDLELTVTYRAKSYNALTNWLNAFRHNIVNGVTVNNHDILYNYSLPDDLLAYMNMVHKATETVAPYGKTLKQFFIDSTCDKGLLIRKNLNDSSQRLAINDKQDGCVGRFTQMPVLQETQKEPPVSSVSFTYTLHYERIWALALHYQVYIHNQRLNLSFFKPYFTKLQTHPQVDALTSISNRVSKLGYLNQPNTIIHSDDGYFVPNLRRSLSPKKIYPIQLNTANLHQVVSFNELAPEIFPTALIPTLLLFKDAMITAKAFPIYFELREVSDVDLPIELAIDSLGNITSLATLNPRNRYYFVVYSSFDFSMIDLSLLRINVELLLWLANWLTPDSMPTEWDADNPLWKYLIGLNYITDDGLLLWINLITNNNYELLQFKQPMTVLQSRLRSTRRLK